MRNLNRQQQARPARRPDYLITLPGRQISPELDARLTILTLVDKRGFESDQLDITLSDHDGRVALPPRGAEIQLSLGWRGEGLVDRGTFIVDEVEHSGGSGGDTITVRARAADMLKVGSVKRSQSWHEITLGEILEAIASRHELTPRVGAGLDPAHINHIDQTDESDAHFLTRLADRYDADATIKAQNLVFVARGAGRTASGLAIPPLTIRRSDGDNHRFVQADRNAHSGVKAWWHNPQTAERTFVLVGSDENAKSLRGNNATEAEALIEAQSEWQRIRRAGSSLTLTLAEGLPNLYAETPVVARGWKPEIDDTEWVATEVTHTMSDSGYTCSVSCEVIGSDDGEVDQEEQEFEDDFE
ncbi:MAG: contractile injection system protein, VgrG/Pvc8 family [Pseudohongiella sp.]|nr:contractile injection system protein, VgrG/Pvc8 family [Pseudohongiella sp.]